MQPKNNVRSARALCFDLTYLYKLKMQVCMLIVLSNCCTLTTVKLSFCFCNRKWLLNLLIGF